MENGGHFQQFWDWFVAAALGPAGAAIAGRLAWLSRSRIAGNWSERLRRAPGEAAVVFGGIVVGLALGDRFQLSITQTSGIIFVLSYLGPEGIRPLAASLWDWWKGRAAQ